MFFTYYRVLAYTETVSFILTHHQIAPTRFFVGNLKNCKPEPLPSPFYSKLSHSAPFHGFSVYMRKLATARVLYQHVFWFRIAFTWWLGHFTSCYLKVHFMLIKCMCDSKSRTLRMHYPFRSTDRPILHRNGWSFRAGWINAGRWNERSALHLMCDAE